jgi:DNA invertase Pin-like site-specific DNA recombinase
MSAKARGKKLGRPRADEMKRLKAISRLPKQSVGINKIARQLGIGVSGVQRIVNAQ